MKLYYVDVKVFDTFEETSSLIRKAIIATDEDNARDIVAKQMEEEIKSAEAPCTEEELERELIHIEIQNMIRSLSTPGSYYSLHKPREKR